MSDLILLFAVVEKDPKYPLLWPIQMGNNGRELSMWA